MFYVKISSKMGIVLGYEECSIYKSCKTFYEMLFFELSSLEFHKYIEQIYLLMLDELKDRNQLNCPGMIVDGAVLRKYNTGHLNEEPVAVVV